MKGMYSFCRHIICNKRCQKLATDCLLCNTVKALNSILIIKFWKLTSQHLLGWHPRGAERVKRMNIVARKNKADWIWARHLLWRDICKWMPRIWGCENGGGGGVPILATLSNAASLYFAVSGYPSKLKRMLTLTLL